jgi:hypothetical protein
VSLQRVQQLLENAGSYPEQESADITSLLVRPMLVEREQSFQAFMALPDSALTPDIVNGTNKNGVTPFNLALSYYDTESMLRLVRCGVQTDTLRLQLLADGCEFRVIRAILNNNTLVSEHAPVSWEQLRSRYPRDKKRSKLVERIFQNQGKLIPGGFGEMESKQGAESGESGQRATPDLQALGREQSELDAEHNKSQERVDGAVAVRDAQEIAVSDEKVRFIPESLAFLTVLFGSGALIHHFKIDKLVDQYVFGNQP